MKSKFSFSVSILTILTLVFTSSCEKDKEVISGGDALTVSEEAVIDAYFQDIDDVGAVAIDAPSDNQFSGGRTSTTIVIQDDRFNCDGVIVSVEPSVSSTTQHPVGVITVDFGTTGCHDVRGNVRKGKLIFNYDGWRFLPGSVVVLTTENYSINDVKLDGVRTSVNVSTSEADAPSFHVTLQDGKATFADGSVATRESDITWSWIRGANMTQDKLIILSNSTANGTTKAGTADEVSLPAQLEYHRFCPIAVSGVKKYVIDGNKEFTVDYGSGTCDRVITVAIGDQTKIINL